MNAASLKQNKWVRRGVVALLVLLAVWAIAWVAVPPIAKGQIQKIASEKLGRQVTVGKIDFKPWTLELTVNDLRIATADGTRSQVAIKRIYLDGELQSILAGKNITLLGELGFENAYDFKKQGLPYPLNDL